MSGLGLLEMGYNHQENSKAAWRYSPFGLHSESLVESLSKVDFG